MGSKQWGYQDAKEESVTFPVAVNSVIVIFRIPLRYLEQEAKYLDPVLLSGPIAVLQLYVSLAHVPIRNAFAESGMVIGLETSVLVGL